MGNFSIFRGERRTVRFNHYKSVWVGSFQTLDELARQGRYSVHRPRLDGWWVVFWLSSGARAL